MSKTDKFWRDSGLEDSVLYEYVNNRSDNAITDRKAAFDLAVKAFQSEATAAFAVQPHGTSAREYPSAVRFELTRYYIIKVLLFIGYRPNDVAFGLIATLIEMRIRQPDAAFTDMLKKISHRTGIPYQTLDRDLERSFSYYDSGAIKRVTYLTDTQPMSARDVVCDLAVHVKTKFIDDVYSIYA